MASYLSYRNVLLSNSTVIASTLNAGSVSYSTLTGSTMSTRGLNVSTLTGSTITVSTLSGSTINVSTLSGSTITVSTLSGSTINVSTLQGSTITISTLSGSTINVSTLTGSTLTGTTVFFSTMTASTILTAGSTINLARNVNVPNRFVEIGCDVADSMYLDFHSKDSTLPDYSTRIISQGGATTGTGGLNMYASTIGLMATNGVGIGTTAPQASLHVNGNTLVSNPTVYVIGTAAWYIIGYWDCSAAVNAGARLKVRVIGCNGYDSPSVSGNGSGGETTIYLTNLNGINATYVNIDGIWKHEGGASPFTTIKVVQNGASRSQYYVYAYVQTYTQHAISAETTQGTIWTTQFTSTSDPGANSASVQQILMSSISAAGNVTIGTGLTTDLGGGLKTQYTNTNATPATIAGDYYAYGTLSGSGPYTFTTNVASGAYWTIVTGIRRYSTYKVTLTVRGTVGSSFNVYGAGGGPGVFSNLTATDTTWTGNVTTGQYDNIYINIVGVSGTQFILTSATVYRLDTVISGNVGIGTTAPITNLHVRVTPYATPIFIVDAGNQGVDSISVPRGIGKPLIGVGAYSWSNISSGDYYGIGFGYNGNNALTSYYPAEIGFLTQTTTGGEYGDMVFSTRATTTSTTIASERMRITSSGSVGIGTTNPTSVLTVNNTGAYQTHHLIIRGQEFYQSGYTGSGVAINVGVNRSANKQLWIMDPDLASNSTNAAIRLLLGSGTCAITSVSTDGLIGLPISISGSAVSVSTLGTGTVYSNGGVLTNTNPSDESLKTNIEPLHVSVDLLNPVQYNWIDTEKHGSSLQFGFLANEVQTIFPNIVSTWIDNDGSEKLGYDTVSLIPVLTSAIKEQNSKISAQAGTIDSLQTQLAAQSSAIAALEARLAALESK